MVPYDNTTILNRKFPETNIALGTKVHVAFHFQSSAEEFLHSSARHKMSMFQHQWLYTRIAWICLTFWRAQWGFFFCRQLFVVAFNYFLGFTNPISDSYRIAVVLRPIVCIRIVLWYTRMAQSGIFFEVLWIFVGCAYKNIVLLWNIKYFFITWKVLIQTSELCVFIPLIVNTLCNFIVPDDRLVSNYVCIPLITRISRSVLCFTTLVVIGL